LFTWMSQNLASTDLPFPDGAPWRCVHQASRLVRLEPSSREEGHLRCRRGCHSRIDCRTPQSCTSLGLLSSFQRPSCDRCRRFVAVRRFRRGRGFYLRTVLPVKRLVSAVRQFPASFRRPRSASGSLRGRGFYLRTVLPVKRLVSAPEQPAVRSVRRVRRRSRARGGGIYVGCCSPVNGNLAPDLSFCPRLWLRPVPRPRGDLPRFANQVSPGSPPALPWAEFARALPSALPASPRSRSW